MNTIDAIVLLPFISLTVAAVVIMLVISFFRNHKLVFGLTLAGLAATFASLFVALPLLPRTVTVWLGVYPAPFIDLIQNALANLT
jgi:NADH-quinone oxidoreductase subunit N